MRTLICAIAVLFAFAAPAHADAVAHIQAAQDAMRIGNYEAAIKQFTAALTADDVPADAVPELYYRRGVAYKGVGSLKLAIGDFTKAIWTGSFSSALMPRAHLSRGRTYELMGERDLALNDFTQAVQIRPDFAEARYFRALMLRDMGRTDEAIEDLHLASEGAHPEPHLPLYELAMLLAAKGEKAEARSLFARVLKIQPDFRPAEIELAQLGGGPNTSETAMPVSAQVAAAAPPPPDALVAEAPPSTPPAAPLSPSVPDATGAPTPILPSGAASSAPPPAVRAATAPVATPAPQTVEPPTALSATIASLPSSSEEEAPAPAAPPPAAAAVASASPLPAARPEPPATPARTAPAASGNSLVQVGAFVDAALAETSWSRLIVQHPDLLGGQNHHVQEALSNGRRVFRLKVGPLSKQEARALCGDLKAKGTDCLVGPS